MSIKVFAFLIEPGSYTVDLIENVYRPLNIDHIFFHTSAEIAKSNNSNVVTSSLKELSVFKRLLFLANIKKEYDLIVFNGYNHPEFIIFFLLNLFSSKKSIIAIESDTRYRKRGGIKGLIKKLYLKAIFSNKYILGFAGGNYVHKDLFRNYGMKEKNILLMPMMVNNNKFYKNSNKSEKNGFSFLFVGRMIPLKQIEMLITCFLKNFKHNRAVSLNIVGDGELYEPLKSKYDQYENIFFKGAKFDKDLIEEYHNADVLVLPSDREQWGLVVNEALAAGLPVICSDQVGAIYDLVEGRETGLVFKYNDPGDLANKMLLLYEDKERYNKYSHNAVKMMKEYWNYDLYRNCLIEGIKRAEYILAKEEG